MSTILITVPPDTKIQPFIREIQAALARIARDNDCKCLVRNELGRVSYELVKRQEATA